MRLPVDCLLGDELQQISEPGALLEGRTGNNSLYELPALIVGEIVSGLWLWNRGLRGGHHLMRWIESLGQNEVYHRLFSIQVA